MTDKDVFCENIRLCERAMYALAFSVVRNDSDAADVISESIYRAYRNLHTLKNDDSFKPWLLRIVHNTAVELIRKNSKIITVDEVPDMPSDGCEGDITVRLALRDAVNSLKLSCRTVVILFYYENLSIVKIAQITGSNVASVKKQLSRARRMLREILKEDFNS